MKAFITGVTGFVGDHLRASLMQTGVEVYGIDSRASGEDVVACDLRDQERLESLLAELRPERIYHLAGISYPAHGNWMEIYEVNFLGTASLFEAILRAGLDARVLLVSSSYVYGASPSCETPLSELHPLNPLNDYAVSKSCAELLASKYRALGMDIRISRSFNHTGRGQNEIFLVPKLVKAFLQKERALKLGNLDSVRDFLDVRDVVVAYKDILECPQGGNEVFNVCSGKGYSVRDVIRHLELLTGFSPEVEVTESFVRSDDIPCQIGDGSKLRRVTGWKPRYGFEETLRWMLS